MLDFNVKNECYKLVFTIILTLIIGLILILTLILALHKNEPMSQKYIPVVEYSIPETDPNWDRLLLYIKRDYGELTLFDFGRVEAIFSLWSLLLIPL